MRNLIHKLFNCITVIGLLLQANLVWADVLSKEDLKNNSTLSFELMTNLKSKIYSTIDHNRKKNYPSTDQHVGLIQCIDDEFQFLEISHSVLYPLQKMFMTKNFTHYKSLLSSNFKSNSFSGNKILESKNFDLIAYSKYQFSNERINSLESKKDLEKFLSFYREIGFVEFVPLLVESEPETRDINRAMRQASISLKFTIRGIQANDAKIENRGELRAFVVLENGKWKLGRLSLVQLEKLSTSKEFFRKVSNTNDISKLIPTHLRREAIRRGGYALAIDNNDSTNNSKLFVSTVAESVMLERSKDGKITKIINPELEKQTLVKSAAFVDFENKGSRDLLMVRFAPNESQKEKDRSDIQIFRSLSSKFEKREKVINFNQETAYAMPLAVADFNNDSFLDFYIGFPGAKDFTTLGKPLHENGLATQGVFFNQKDGTFKDDPYKAFSRIYNKPETDKYIFAHSAMAADYNNDRKIDLIIVDDRGNLSPIYENVGNGEFISANEKIGIGLKDYGMGIDVADLNNDGKFDMVMSSVNFTASKRINDSCGKNWNIKNAFVVGTNGLRVFQAKNESKFVESTLELGLDFVGEGAAGVKILDYNNDGFQDIYLTAGLWSGSEKDSSQDISSYFIAASSLGILEDGLRSELKNKKFIYDKVKANNDFKSLLFNSDSQSAVMDILSFFRGDLSTNQPGVKKALSFAGNQPNRMFRNNGDGTYTEVGYMLGVDSISDGYMVASASFDRNGLLDLVLRNADPGFSVDQFSPLEMYKNVSPLKNNSLTLELVGSRSNRDAVGAFVEARIGNKTLIGQMIGNSGTVQSQRLIHFGLGKNKMVDSLKVIWPSGITQVFYKLKKGFHKIEESEKLASLR